MPSIVFFSGVRWERCISKDEHLRGLSSLGKSWWLRFSFFIKLLHPPSVYSAFVDVYSHVDGAIASPGTSGLCVTMVTWFYQLRGIVESELRLG
jgi:hypothetical protein